MTPGPFPGAHSGSARRRLPEVGFIAASIIWAAVMIDTGDIAWPLAMWVGTALTPLALYRRKAREQGQSTTC